MITPGVVADGRVDHTFNNPDRTNYFVSTSTVIAATPRGADYAGHRNADAGVMVDLRDDKDANAIQLNVDGRAKKINRRMTFVPLSEFRRHTVRFRPVGGQALRYEAGALRIIPFPGNVVRLNPTFLRLVSLFGRVVDTEGWPMPNLILRFGDAEYRTDEGGYFIVDAPAGLTSVQGQIRNVGECVMALPDLTGQQDIDFLDLGDMVCNAGTNRSSGSAD